MLTLRGLANEWVVTTNSKKSAEVIVGIDKYWSTEWYV